MYSQSEVKSLLINTQGDVIGCKVMVMPSGSVSEKHKKLIRRGELFQMILPPSYPGSSFLQKIGQKFINKAQKLERNIDKQNTLRQKKGFAFQQADLFLIEQWLKNMHQILKRHASRYISR